MTGIVIGSLVYWFFAAIYCWRRMDKEWPQIEANLVSNDALANALGQVPPPIKKFGYFVTTLLAPGLVPLYVYDHWKEVRGKRKVRRTLKKLKGTIASIGADGHDVRDLQANIARLETLLQKEGRI